MNWLWKYATCSALSALVMFSLCILLHVDANTPLTILIANTIILTCTAIRNHQVKTGRSRLVNCDLHQTTITPFIHKIGMIRQLWMCCTMVNHGEYPRNSREQTGPYEHKCTTYYSKAYFNTACTMFPITGLLYFDKKSLRVHTPQGWLDTYGRACVEPPGSKKTSTVHAGSSWHLALIKPVSWHRRLFIASPYLLAVPLFGLWWYCIEHNALDSLLIMLAAVPVCFWWQAYQGNDPSSVDVLD